MALTLCTSILMATDVSAQIVTVEPGDSWYLTLDPDQTVYEIPTEFKKKWSKK